MDSSEESSVDSAGHRLVHNFGCSFDPKDEDQYN